MNSIMLSVRPEWAVKILNGEKTIEVRKTVPHEVLEWLKDTSKPFPEITYFMYVTKGKPYYFKRVCDNTEPRVQYIDWDTNIDISKALNGKVVAKFTLKKVELGIMGSPEMLRKACISYDELLDYARTGSLLYALYITDLVVFDKPKELGEFKSNQYYGRYPNGVKCREWLPMKKAFQSWGYVEYEDHELENMHAIAETNKLADNLKTMERLKKESEEK